MTGVELRNGMLAAASIEEFLITLATGCVWVIDVRHNGEPWNNAVTLGGYKTKEAALLTVLTTFSHKDDNEVRVRAVEK